MAQAYPYWYKGTLRMKQDKCVASMPLDKPRIWLDFNELCAVGKDGKAPVYLFAQADIVNDSDGKDIELFEGMEVSVFDDDLDAHSRPDALLADGVVLRNVLGQYPKAKWLIQLTETKAAYPSGKDYVYWMSDLR